MHVEFKKQCLEMTVDKLLEQFAVSKCTGSEKPGIYNFLWLIFRDVYFFYLFNFFPY